MFCSEHNKLSTVCVRLCRQQQPRVPQISHVMAGQQQTARHLKGWQAAGTPRCWTFRWPES